MMSYPEYSICVRITVYKTIVPVHMPKESGLAVTAYKTSSMSDIRLAWAVAYLPGSLLPLAANSFNAYKF
jgi:hypothetical protein